MCVLVWGVRLWGRCGVCILPIHVIPSSLSIAPWSHTHISLVLLRTHWPNGPHVLLLSTQVWPSATVKNEMRSKLIKQRSQKCRFTWFYLYWCLVHLTANGACFVYSFVTPSRSSNLRVPASSHHTGKVWPLQSYYGIVLLLIRHSDSFKSTVPEHSIFVAHTTGQRTITAITPCHLI